PKKRCTAAALHVLDLSNLRRVLNSIDGESHHRGERLRRIDGGDLRCAGEFESTGAGRAAARRTTFYNDVGGKLSGISGWYRWPRAYSQHAQASREIWRSFLLRRSDRF